MDTPTFRAATCLMLIGASLGLSADAIGESQLASGAGSARLSASAHVDFRIVIPPVLGLTTGQGNRVSITSNTRSVTLNAGDAASSRHAAGSGGVVLTAAAHGVIIRDTPCGIAPLAGPRTPLRGGITDLSHNVMVCTAAMP